MDVYKISYLIPLLLSISCGSGSGVGANSFEPVPQSDTLIDGTQLLYKGAFRISSDTFGDSSLNYAIGTLAYNPANHSLFIAGHDHHRAIAEFAIPELLDRPTLNELNVVETPIQSFKSILNASSGGNPEGINRITGLLYIDGQLIVNAEESYDAGGGNKDTTLVLRDAKNIATSTIDGYYQLSGGARAAGYMAPIPQEWQTDFGGPYLTGWSSVYSINSRYSIGPSLFVFDSESLLGAASGSMGPISTTAYMNFSYSGGNFLSPDALQKSQGSASPIWNLLSRGMYGFIVPGTSTFAVFGSSGGVDSGIGYKITQDSGRLCGGYCSYEAADNYNYYWLFDVKEILNATQVYDIQPYAYGRLSVPFDNQGKNRIIGGTFDPGTGMLYLSLRGAGQVGKYDRPPLIVGYQVAIP